MAISSDGSGAFRRTMRDLVALSALPAVWAGYRPPQVVEGLAGVLLSTLRLDLVYIRLPGQMKGQGIEVACTAGGSASTGQTRDIGRTRSEEHTSELQSHSDLVCRLLLEKKKKSYTIILNTILYDLITLIDNIHN